MTIFLHKMDTEIQSCFLHTIDMVSVTQKLIILFLKQNNFKKAIVVGGLVRRNQAIK